MTGLDGGAAASTDGAPVAYSVGSGVPAIELRGIVKRFPGVVANDGIDLAVAPGSIHAVVGENGAGKSTLMKILYGEQRPDEGSIWVRGVEQSFKSPRDAIAVGIGMVHQHFMLADNLTVLENVVLGAEKLYGIGGRARARIKEISDAYGLSVRPDALVEDEDARSPVEHLHDLDPLPVTDAEVGDEGLGRHGEAVHPTELPDPVGGLPEVDPEGRPGLVSQDDVLLDGEVVGQHEVLVHHADADRDGVTG